MSLLHQAMIFERYGPRLTMEQLGEALGLATQTVYNQVAKGTCKVKTYVDGGKRFADYRDLAAYLDSVRERSLA